eukprot:1150416-Pelagomonas_calceolata.AAC.2
MGRGGNQKERKGRDGKGRGSGAGISCRDQHDVMMLGSTRCGFEGVPAGRRVCKSGHPGCLLEENKAPSIKSQGASRAVMASMPFYSLLITCISNGETGALMSAMLPPCTFVPQQRTCAFRRDHKAATLSSQQARAKDGHVVAKALQCAFRLFINGYTLQIERCCWTPLKCGGPCPQPRKMHTAVVAGNRLLVVGGDRDAGAALHVYRKKPSAKTHGCQAIGQRKTLCNTGQGKKTGCQTAGNRTASMSWWWPEAV